MAQPPWTYATSHVAASTAMGELKLKPWEVAAASLIVAEAGGELSDFRSERFDIRGRGTLAGNPLIDEPMHPITAAIETKHVD
jgi:fructose-1,6-bisphosphatase/inositol monophosphatase family enzyme